MTSQVEQDACSFKGAYRRNGRQWVKYKIISSSWLRLQPRDYVSTSLHSCGYYWTLNTRMDNRTPTLQDTHPQGNPNYRASPQDNQTTGNPPTRKNLSTGHLLTLYINTPKIPTLQNQCTWWSIPQDKCHTGFLSINKLTFVTWWILWHLLQPVLLPKKKCYF